MFIFFISGSYVHWCVSWTVAWALASDLINISPWNLRETRGCGPMFYELCRVLNEQTKGNNSTQRTRDTTTKTWFVNDNSTWHVSKYRVHKLHQGYILKRVIQFCHRWVWACCSPFTNRLLKCISASVGQWHLNDPDGKKRGVGCHQQKDWPEMGWQLWVDPYRRCYFDLKRPSVTNMVLQNVSFYLHAPQGSCVTSETQLKV